MGKVKPLTRKDKLNTIHRVISEYYKIDSDLLLSESRLKELMIPRMIFYYISYKKLGLPLIKLIIFIRLTFILNNKVIESLNYSTIVYYNKRVKQQYLLYKEYKESLKDILLILFMEHGI